MGTGVLVFIAPLLSYPSRHQVSHSLPWQHFLTGIEWCLFLSTFYYDTYMMRWLMMMGSEGMRRGWSRCGISENFMREHSKICEEETRWVL